MVLLDTIKVFSDTVYLIGVNEKEEILQAIAVVDDSSQLTTKSI